MKQIILPEIFLAIRVCDGAGKISLFLVLFLGEVKKQYLE